MADLYADVHEPTLELDLTPFRSDDDEPTSEVFLAKSDAIWAAQEQERSGNLEAAAYWLAVAGGLDGR